MLWKWRRPIQKLASGFPILEEIVFARFALRLLMNLLFFGIRYVIEVFDPEFSDHFFTLGFSTLIAIKIVQHVGIRFRALVVGALWYNRTREGDTSILMSSVIDLVSFAALNRTEIIISTTLRWISDMTEMNW
jgi:hypothetical protein